MQHLGWLLPQSNLRFASSLLEGAFWCVQPPPESCPRLRGKWTRTYVSGRKGNGSKMPSCLTVPPQLRLRSAERWLEYGRLAALPLVILPILPDSPLAASPTGRARLKSPASGGAFWCSTNTACSAVPLRGAIVSMGLRGPKGRNRNLPWPPGKKVYKIICSVFCLFYSLRKFA